MPRVQTYILCHIKNWVTLRFNEAKSYGALFRFATSKIAGSGPQIRTHQLTSIIAFLWKLLYNNKYLKRKNY